MAAPVQRSMNHRVIGAVSIAGPTFRLTPERMEELAPLVLAAAAELSSVSTEIHALAK
jgi:IclR family acetate operon transcriptional repressor